MDIKSLKLSGFRNFKKKEIDFNNKTTVIVGDNAVGKTNILEGIYLLATGKSFKARLEREIINYEADIARVTGVLSMKYKVSSMNGGGDFKINDTKNIIRNTNLEVVLTNGEVELHGGGVQKAQKKKLLVNGVSKRLLDFAGNLKVVLFGPWDMDLVTASPSLRRRFLDSVLSQTNREYRRSIMIYEKGLRQRNRLLLRIRDENLSRGQLMYWDKLLIKHGEYVTGKREEFIFYINDGWSMTPLRSSSYEGQANYKLEYDRSVISEGRLAQYKDEEVAAGTTLVGPHRDDMIFKIKNQNLKVKNTIKSSKVNKEERDQSVYGLKGESGISRNLAIYGSRGEQRMGVLWLKLAELSYVESATGEKPVLLLDDIFSELDHEHRDIVIESCSNQQTIITTADPHYVKGVKGDVIEI